MRGTRIWLAALAALGAGAVWAPDAGADGLPIPGVSVKSGGVGAPDSSVRYSTKISDGRTSLTRRDTSGRTAPFTVSIKGRYTVPAVGLDGSPGGLSADGATLALIKPRVSFPQSRTRLVILDAHAMSVARRVDLPGDFSFDAISPDGTRLYLIDYLSKRDATKYAVRALDTADGRLVPGAIVDPREEDPDEMRGYPITRVASPDGRWAYTLYSGTKRPFVHALDTAAGRARCIDLPSMKGSVYNDRLRLGAGGAVVSVRGPQGQALADIDTATLEAHAPGTLPGRSPADPQGSAGGARWEALGAAAVAGIGALAWWAILGRRRSVKSA